MELAATYISCGTYLFTGYLAGFISATSTFKKTIENTEQLSDTSPAKRHRPNAGLLDGLEISQAITVGILFISLIGLMASHVAGNEEWLNIMQVICNTLAAISAIGRVAESEWLNYRNEQLSEAYIAELGTSNRRLRQENQRLTNSFHHQQNHSRQLDLSLHSAMREVNAYKKVTNFNSVQRRVLRSPYIDIWISKGLPRYFSQISNIQTENVFSEAISDYLQQNKLNIREAINVAPNQRGLLEHTLFSHYSTEQNLAPRDVLRLLDDNIRLSNLSDIAVRYYIENNLLHLFDAVHLSREQCMALQNQTNTASLLQNRLMNLSFFLSLTPLQIRTINSIKSDRVINILRLFTLNRFTHLSE